MDKLVSAPSAPSPGPLQHTRHHRNCPACNARRDEKIANDAFAKLPFRLAAGVWLKESAQAVQNGNLSPKAHEQREYYVRTLEDFFGTTPLEEIHIGNIETYVDERLKTPRKTNPKADGKQLILPEVKYVGASCVRHEVTCLGQILDRGGLWDEIKKHYHPPKLRKSTVGKALEDEQQTRLFTVACSNRRWKVAYWGSLITAQTAADHGEIRHLHLNDVDLGRPTLRIRDGLKNEHRDRIVELKELPDVRWALGQILKRYFRICKQLHIEPDPEHYILPGRHHGERYDPTICMGSWKKAWGALREKAGMPKLRMKDLRHHALTKLLENPENSERTIIEIAGHVSKEMWGVYSHIRRKPKQEAMKTLHFERPKPSLVDSVETVETVDILAHHGANVQEQQVEKKV
jgi:integrase